jgi:hypothetical protein
VGLAGNETKPHFCYVALRNNTKNQTAQSFFHPAFVPLGVLHPGN